MRRRLHTLYASAVVFRNDMLAGAVKEGIDCLDGARTSSRTRRRGAGVADQADQAVTRAARRRGRGRGSCRGARVGRLEESCAGRTLKGMAPVTPSATHLSPFSLSRPPPKARLRRLPPRRHIRPPPAPSCWRTIARHSCSACFRGLALPAAREHGALQELLANDSLVVNFVESARALLEATRDDTVLDVIVADSKLLLAENTIEALRNDTTTDFVPIVFSESGRQCRPRGRAARGTDERVFTPVRSRSLGPHHRPCDRYAGGVGQCAGGAGSDATLDEVAERVAEEIRRGIVDEPELAAICVFRSARARRCWPPPGLRFRACAPSSASRARAGCALATERCCAVLPCWP